MGIFTTIIISLAQYVCFICNNDMWQVLAWVYWGILSFFILFKFNTSLKKEKCIPV